MANLYMKYTYEQYDAGRRFKSLQESTNWKQGICYFTGRFIGLRKSKNVLLLLDSVQRKHSCFT